MRRPRITIAGLLGLVAFVAVTFAALRRPTEAWDSGVFGLLLLVLLTSTLLAVHRSGGRRSFWLGFSLFGWAYVGLSLVPPIEARLPTRKGFEQAWELMTGPDFVVADDYLIYTSAPSNASNPTASTSPVITGPPDKWDVVVFPDPGPSTPAKYIKRLVGLPGETVGNFVRIGHSVLALVLAIVGGCLSWRLYTSRHSRRDSETDLVTTRAV